MSSARLDVALPRAVSPGPAPAAVVIAPAGLRQYLDLRSPISASDAPVLRSAYGRTKRGFDIAAVLLTSPLWLPLLAMLMTIIRLDSPGPVLFRQPRVGQRGRTFFICKLRSMKPGADQLLVEHLASCGRSFAEWERSAKLRRDPRLTRVGKWLRRSSLDELPQVFNVLRGDMALVGPRPLPLAELPRYGPSIKHYIRVRPGLTGLWQVSGRNELPYAARIRLDRHYLRHCGWRLDLRLLIATIPALLTRRGAY